MKKTKKETKTDSGILSSRFTFWVVIPCGLFILAHFITSFFPHLRVWGVNHLAYFPIYVRIILVVLSFSLFIPKINHGVRIKARGILEFLREQIPKDKCYLWYAVFSLLTVVLFWVLRSRTYFLGDGFNLVTDLNTGVKTWVWSELLESLLYVQLHKFLNLFFSVDGQLTYQVGSLVAGAIFVFLIFLFSDYLGNDLFEKAFIFFILATMGSVQLFLGYAEHYSYVFIIIFGYIFFSLRGIEKGVKIVIPTLFFLLSAAFHFSSFLLLPSLLYLFFLTGSGGVTVKKFLLIAAGALLALVLVSIYVYTSKPLIIRIFVLPFEGKFTAGYTSFSSAHLMDILNELLLIAPAGVILILGTLLAAFGKIDIKNHRIFFLILVAGFGFIYHFTFDPLLGAARDWDMFAITSLGYTVLGICLFLNVSRKSEPLKYASLVLACTSAFSLLPWIAVNANEVKSVQRFRDVLELDPQKSKSGRFFLIQYFDKKGMIEEVKKEDLHQKETYPARYLALQAREYYDHGMPDTALDMLRRAVELDPFSSEIRYHFGKIYYLQGNLDSAEIQYKQALQLKPENIGAYIDLAQIYIRQRLWDKALEQYNMVMKFRIEDPGVYNNVGNIHLSQNRPDEAIKYFRRAVKLRDDFVLARLGLARALSKTGQVDEAIKELETTLQLQPDFADAYFYLGYLYRDKGQAKAAKLFWEQFLRLSADPQQSGEIRNALDSLRSP